MDIYMAESGGMRFVLNYSGPLPPNGSVGEKHEIRRALLPQLRRYWHIDEALTSLEDVDPQSGRAPIDDISVARGGFRFVPVVTRHFHLVCSLEITLLRDEPPGNVIRPGGDIDNRVKTLFDSLSLPVNQDQLRGLAPTPGENPFYCLLEDDSLVAGFQIRSERLLEPLASPNDVRLTIAATIRPTKVTIGNMRFLGGWL